jgi:hypothetical protein
MQGDEFGARHVLNISSNQGLKDEQYASGLAQLRGMADMPHPVINQHTLVGG